MKKTVFVCALGAACVAFLDPALATPTVTDSIENVGKNTATLPTLLNYGSYILGAALGVSGVQKLRQHTDSPQVPMSDGLSRLVASAFFISLPMVLGMLQRTADTDSGTVGTYGAINALT